MKCLKESFVMEALLQQLLPQQNAGQEQAQ